MEEEDISSLKERLAVAEQKARDSEAMMIQAAEYGKDLLEKNIALESNFDTLQQEKHELHLKLQVSSQFSSQFSCNQDAIFMRHSPIFFFRLNQVLRRV